METRIGIVALLAAALFLAFGVQGADFTKAIKDRQGLMKSNSSHLKALSAAAKEGNMADVEKLARELASNFGKIADPALFPKGSTGEDTRAKPVIWEDWKGFEGKAATARKLAQALAAQAKAGKMAEAKTLAGSLGKEACTNCHKTFRGPKKKAM